MKVFVNAPYGLSRAMTRVANALKRTAPEGVEIVEKAELADLVMLHIIGYPDVVEAITKLNCQYGVIQYCLKTTQRPNPADWREIWQGANIVWSYYDIPNDGVNFYHSPLGIDSTFVNYNFKNGEAIRDHAVMTSGYVASASEAIEECAVAAISLNQKVIHLGPPNVVGMPTPKRNWKAYYGISDSLLADLYSQVRFVSGLRFTEGFELPVIEGLACGARPIVFDRPDTQWFEGHVISIPECSGAELVERLKEIFSQRELVVTSTERDFVLSKFNWNKIGQGFWDQVQRA